MFGSTKTWPCVFSTAFRQPRAASHCHFLHGYALTITLDFEADYLDANNWVQDFGALGQLKGKLARFFDHKTVVAEDDPELGWFLEAERRGVLELTIMEQVGCEAFAKFVGIEAETHLAMSGNDARVRLRRVTVAEHLGNSAYWEPSHT